MNRCNKCKTLNKKWATIKGIDYSTRVSDLLVHYYSKSKSDSFYNDKAILCVECSNINDILVQDLFHVLDKFGVLK